MSGVTDAPFRRLAFRLGAGMVVTEMIACQQLAQQDPQILQKAEQAQIYPFVIQLAGREVKWMAEGARICEALGADIIDINMGCPAKQVTRGLSGSALMRDLDHALCLIEATVNAVNVPVTLKMRLGWDDNSINAPELAKRAENAGVQMITVHGRTRCQFYKGSADWQRIAQVKQAVNIPIVANGDITSFEDIDNALAASCADAVMIGRGAYGAPWLLGQAAHYLHYGEGSNMPAVKEVRGIMQEHYEDMLQHYGTFLGMRNARKHLGWYVETLLCNEVDRKIWRARLCREENPKAVLKLITQFCQECLEVIYDRAA